MEMSEKRIRLANGEELTCREFIAFRHAWMVWMDFLDAYVHPRVCCCADPEDPDPRCEIHGWVEDSWPD